MRASAFDTRLEAIAGKPYLAVTAPLLTDAAAAGTAVFAGLKPSPDNHRVAIQNRSGAGSPSVNLYWISGGETLSRLGATVLASEPVTAGYASITESRLGLGRGNSAVQYWDTPFMGVAYDRVLSDAEAVRVARWLARRLSLSLSLSL